MRMIDYMFYTLNINIQVNSDFSLTKFASVYLSRYNAKVKIHVILNK